MAEQRAGRAEIEVVVIDDDDELRNLVQMLLELDGRFEVSAMAADGRAGYDAIERTCPAAAIVDLDLPEIQGPVLIEMIRQVSPRTKIVVFSSFPDPFTLFDVVRRGADAYLDKATSWLELVPTLATLCGLDTDDAEPEPEHAQPRG